MLFRSGVGVFRVDLSMVGEPMVPMSALKLVSVDLPRVGHSMLLLPTVEFLKVELYGVELFGMLQPGAELPNTVWTFLSAWLSSQELSSTNSKFSVA